jgi:hypothetical protein
VGTNHKQSERCRKWTAIKQDRLTKERDSIVIKGTMFTINNTPIKTVDEFEYLGRILDKNDNDWPGVRRAIK